MTSSTTIAPPDAPSALAQVERWRGTYPEFAVLLQQHASPAVALWRFASTCRSEGRIDLAIEALIAILAWMPGEVAVWRELATIFQTTGQDEQAAACAAKALAFDPEHALTWLQYASVLFRIGRIDEAEHAYLQSLSFHADLVEASLGLGALYLSSRRPDQAIDFLLRSISSSASDAVAYLCLGQAFYMAGRFAESSTAFEQAAALTPLDGVPLRLYARARTFTAIIEGDIGSALASYPSIAGSAAEPLDDVLQAAFSLFSAYGMTEAAILVGRHRLTAHGDDPVQTYLLDAVSGAPLDRAPATYVETHFDQFSEGFDAKLVDVLGYAVPEKLAELVASCRPAFSQMLDLGCGTGLAASHLARFGGTLSGVDLSAKMLALAEQRNAYTHLSKADVIAYLAARPKQFDLIFAADLLIYFGRLDELFNAVATSLDAGGLFAASIETAQGDGFTLLPSGRFGHDDAYIRELSARHFEIDRDVDAELRLEATAQARGKLYVMRRIGA